MAVEFVQLCPAAFMRRRLVCAEWQAGPDAAAHARGGADADARGHEGLPGAAEKRGGRDGGDLEDDEDDEDDFRPRAALEVSGEPDWSVRGPPASAAEYLRRVKWEARQCPNVVRAEGIGTPSPSRRSARAVPVASAMRSSAIMSAVRTSRIPPAPEHAVPDAKWERSLIASFSELRLRVANAMAEADAGPREGRTPGRGSGAAGTSGREGDVGRTISALPSVRDPEAWRRLCVDDEEPAAPSVDLLSRLGETRASILLRHAVSWLEDCEEAGEGAGPAASAGTPNSCPLSKQLCLWIFSLCAAAGKPLDADTCASLRSLLRVCCRLRAGVPAPGGAADPSEEEGPRQVIARLNTLITIAGKYFGQGADLDLDLGAGEATRRHEADD